MNTFELVSSYKPSGDQPEAIKKLMAGLKEGKKEQVLLGVTGSGKTFTMANVVQKWGKKTLVLAHNKTLAAQLYAEFKEFFPHNAVEYFVSYYDYYRPEAYVPGTDTYIEKDASINDEIDKLRHSATRSLLERDDVIIISSVSCIYGIGSPLEYESLKCFLSVDDEYDRDEFLKKLVAIQYERNDYDLSRGNFRVRGDVIDVFPAHEDSQIIRIEFFGDLIENLAIVDPITGQVVSTLDRITIYPKSHYAIGEEKLKSALETIKVELREHLQLLKKENKLVEYQRLEQRTLLDLEMLEEMGYCSGIENYSRHLTQGLPGEPPPTLLDYFKGDYLLIVDESHITLPQVGGMYRGDRVRKMNLVEYGFRLPSALDNRPLNFEEFSKKIDRALYVSATPGDYELEQTHGEYIEQIIRPTGLLDPIVEVRPAENQLDDLLVEIKKCIKKNQRVLITTLTKKLAEELTRYIQGAEIKIQYLHSDIAAIDRIEIINDLRQGEFDVLVGINLLREGLDIPEVGLVAILDADKEGFLRSEKSLIQTIGRAARNSEGRVILYAYNRTRSMEKALEETKRRRNLQDEFNKANGIIPKTILKDIRGGILETLRGVKKKGKKSKNTFKEGDLNLKNVDLLIAELKEEMSKAAKILDFEKAAKIRDEIKALNEARRYL